jgi:hypothetical protein
MWDSTCRSIIEYLTQIWGGYQSLIIPTDGKTIDTVFWKFLSAFDPDFIFYYVRSVHDVQRWAPDQAEQIVEDELKLTKANNPVHVLPNDAELRTQILQRQVGNFAISPDLTEEILHRLSPFHLDEDYRIAPIRLGDRPNYPLTKVADVAPFVPSTDALFVLIDNLPADRVPPPPLWLHAQSGIASEQLQKDLAAVEVTPVPKYMNVETDSTILDWGMIPEVSLGQYAPFGFSRIGLAEVRANAAHPFTLPSIIVRGDTLKDFCFYYAISRTHGRALWLPKWFVPANDEFPSSLVSALRKIEKITNEHQSQYFSMVSLSIPFTELRNLNALIEKYISTFSMAIDDGNDLPYLDRMLKYPNRIYIKGNIDQITTHQIVDEELPGYFESPVPRIFSEIQASKHRWIVEIAFAEHSIARYPTLGRSLVSGPNAYDARASLDGVAYQCPGAFVRGDDIELQMLRVAISVPSTNTILGHVLRDQGYESTLSDKGAYSKETIEKFGGLEKTLSVLRDPGTKSLLDKFLNRTDKKDGVHDQGVFLRDDRRYLDFAPLAAILGTEQRAVNLIDDWIKRGVLYRGFVFKCARCSNTAWFSVESLTQQFICPRCGAVQHYTRSTWINSNEPVWRYKLDEVVYQFMEHNGEVALLTIGALQGQAVTNFGFSPELRIRRSDNPKINMEVDILCLLDNRMVIGEAKSNNSLKGKGVKPPQVVGKYEKLAKQMSASAIVFSTSETEWDEASRKAIEHCRKHNPLLRIYDYRKEQLAPPQNW